ncbi:MULTISPECIES: hypothetical protein [Bradyrhizobium]|jgi:hypothetical protein|uniref:hypothetical protein n=1 Tax=Bradyrhizobium TaxID=374 RepID=UPI000231C910|nr:hypothetical protein [Bradyrhizobium japonicum]AJA61933.1 hypothetical protein RN69_17470 [Bradyrhizobium japonicum]KMK00914.1 hypothetical protein CF64_01445 [Bradyrhizobium japonicum]MCS3541710.1 hypothetical protein [Bradyrhizobium japonicum]MCS3991104.1 hypothetical protein [Bradyrhizobium japonicum]MCS4014086.1 hypothetical protein [Bradyrhizobium japonicum]
MKQHRTTRLEDRIEELRAEIDGIIDQRVARIASGSPGVPAGVIRNLLTARAPSCRCAQYIELCGTEAKTPD